MKNEKCKLCGKKEKRIIVRVEGKREKVVSYQCGCGVFRFVRKAKKRNKKVICLICNKPITDYRKCEIHIKTIGNPTRKMSSWYNTRLEPVCYSCVERLNFNGEKAKKK